MSEGGYIKLYRKLMDNPIWKQNKPFDERSALVDLIFSVRWKDKPDEVLIKGRWLKVQRGECIRSLDTWAERWRWNKSKVRRYLETLKKGRIIETVDEKVTTRIKLCNYGFYQDLRHDIDTLSGMISTRGRHEADTTATPEEEGKERREGEKGEEGNGAPPSFDSLLSRFQQIHGECARVSEGQFVAALMKCRPEGLGLEMFRGLVGEAISDFETNCADFTTFRPQGCVSKLKNYIEVAIKQHEEEKTKKNRAPKLVTHSLAAMVRERGE